MVLFQIVEIQMAQNMVRQSNHFWRDIVHRMPTQAANQRNLGACDEIRCFTETAFERNSVDESIMMDTTIPRRKLKLRRAVPPNTTSGDQSVEQDVAITVNGGMDTRKLKKPPPDSLPTPNRNTGLVSSAPNSPKVIITPPAVSKRSPPRLEPSAKDSRKKERAFPASIRKLSSVDPPALPANRSYDAQTFRKPEFEQPPSTLSAPNTPNKNGTLSVRERVQMLQSSQTNTTPVRRTDLMLPLKSRTTEPAEINFNEKGNDVEESGDCALKEEPLFPSPLRYSCASFESQSPPSTPAHSKSSLLFHQTPPASILNPYDPDFSLRSQASAKSVTPSILDYPDENSRSDTPPRTGTPQPVATTPVKTNRNDPSPPQQLFPDELLRDPAPPGLTRPMGRPAPDSHRYIVEVASAEWDGDSRVWKYRVLVQKRELQASSFTKAFCFRSVHDFFWLEQALAAEFQGALLVPDLRIVLHVSNAAMASETPVDNSLLQDWLSDILNGYRGAGEWELPLFPQLLQQSASVESFLYKNVLVSPPKKKSPPPTADDKENKSNLLSCGATEGENCMTPNSIVESLSAMFPLDFCGVVMPNREARRSHALATAGDLQMQDSLADTASVLSGAHATGPSSRIASVHSELIQAQRDLATNYKGSSLQCLDCLQSAINHEERVGLAWRRLAETLGGLFRYESDIDLSDAVRVKYMPFRKLEAEVLVDDKLQRMVQAKATRGVPALREVETMLNTYIADLSAVEPSVQAYASSRVVDHSDMNSINTTEDADDKASKLRWDDFRDWTRYNTQIDTPNNTSASSIPPPPVKLGEARKRFATNEKLLRQSLTALFQTAPLRRCRIAWKYLSTEARCCAELKTAAAAMRAELQVVKDTSVSKLRKRHSRDEKSDYSAEMELLQRMVHLGHAQKVQYDSGTESTNSASIGNEIVEVDNDDLSEERSKAIKRDIALELARQRIGHWDAALATSIMEAVGVDDPNVRVEETTRELRIVRKYAIGLRDQLNRCVEAVDALRDVVEKHHLKECRDSFRDAFAVVLSGTVRENQKTPSQKFPPSSQSALRVTGIDTNDTLGWIPATTPQPNGLGDMAVQYFRTRDAQIEWLLSSLSDLFKEYYQRLEVIEGFVYMECVGIQLEKNFSAKRSKALAAFEKKADLTAALAIATKKRLKKVAGELKSKLRSVDASHTAVKETKEAHLESKAVKTALHDLAVRRLVRARELSTERAAAIFEIWSKEEELNAQQEVTSLGKALSRLEQVVTERIQC